MSEVLSTRQELLQLEQDVRSNNIFGLKEKQVRFPQHIQGLQQTFANMQANLNNFRALNQRNLKIADILKSSPDKHVKELQSFGLIDNPGKVTTENTDILYYVEKLKASILPFLKEKNKLEYEVKYVQGQINDLKKGLERVNKVIELQKAKKDPSIDLEEPNIVNGKLAPLIYLREISEKYWRYTHKSDGTYGYTQNPKIDRFLDRILRTFENLGRTVPEVVSTPPTLILDFKDPGAETNQEALAKLIDTFNSTISDKAFDKTASVVLKYADKMYNSLNDPYKSKDIITKVTEALLDTDSVKYQNSTQAQAQEFTGAAMKYFYGFGFSSVMDAKRRAHRDRISRLYSNTPFCEGVPKNPENDAKVKDDAQKTAIESKAGSDVTAKVKNATPANIITQTLYEARNVSVEIFTDVGISVGGAQQFTGPEAVSASSIYVASLKEANPNSSVKVVNVNSIIVTTFLSGENVIIGYQVKVTGSSDGARNFLDTELVDVEDYVRALRKENPYRVRINHYNGGTA